MADSKISDYAAASAPDGTELVEIVQAGVNKRSTVAGITASLSTTTSTSLSTATSSITSLSTSTSTGLSTAVSTGASLSTAVAGKQATLVSATNIKTINSTSLLGAGDLVVSAAPGGSTTEIQYNDAGSLAGDSALTWDKTNNVLAIAQGTLTTSQPQTFTVTWNDGAVTFTGWKMNVTDTASASASLLMDCQIGGSSRFRVYKNGDADFGPIGTPSGITIDVASNYGGPRISSNAANENFMIAIGNVSNSTWGIDGAVGDMRVRSTAAIAFSDAGDAVGNGSANSGSFYRVAASIIGVRGTSLSNGGALSFIEQSAPSAPSANGVYIYAQDNGAGKTQLMALFATGAAQQIAIEP